MPAVFYVWDLKQAFILQNVSEAQLDQHIWEPAQEDADNIWISKALHTKSSLNTEEKYNTETQNPKIKNIKLKWQDSESFFFFLYCILSVSFLKCSAPSAMENGSMLKTHKEDQHCAEEAVRGQRGRCYTGGKEGCYKSQYSEQQTFQSNKALGTDSCCCLSWITSFTIATKLTTKGFRDKWWFKRLLSLSESWQMGEQ